MSQPVDEVSVAIELDISRSTREMEAAIDAALRDVSGEFDRAFSGIERGAAATGADVGREFERGGEVAEGAIREVERQARTSFDRVGREADQAGLAIAGKLGGALKGLAATGALAAGAAALGGITFVGLRTAATLEQIEVAFGSLLGSVEAGQKTLQDLKDFAATTPFELTQLTGAAQRFLAFNDAVGIADDQLLPFLTTLGDIASVTGAGAEGIDRVVLALGQISSRGTISLEDLQQIQEALPGFSAVAIIAAQTGMTTAETLKAISAGAIPAEQGVAALLAGMKEFPGAAGAMEQQSQTLLGVFSTFKDTLSQALAGAFAPVIPSLKESVLEITPVLGEAVEALAPTLGAGLVEIVKGLTPLIGPIGEIINSTLKALTPFIALIAKIALPVLDALVPVFAALEPVIGELAVPITDLVVALTPLLPLIAQILVAVITVAAPLLQLVSIIVSLLSNKAIGPLVEFLAIGFGLLAESIRQFGVWLSQIDWAAVWDAIAGFFADVGSAIGDFFGGIIDFFVSLPIRARQMFEEMRDTAVNRILDLVAFIKGLPARIASALGNLGSLLIEKGKDLIRGLWRGIQETGSWLWGKITGFAKDFILDPIKDVFGISSPSKVMAEQVGRWIPAGIEVGVRGGVGSLNSLIDSLIAPVGGGDGAGVGGVVIGPGAIIINFHGAVPTVEEARAVGEAAGAGVADAIARRGVRTAARMA